MGNRHNGPSRRDFLKAAVTGAAALSFAPPGAAGGARPVPGKDAAFKLKYAPGIGMFEGHAGKSPTDQLKFMADQGFSAWFDNGLMGRPAAEQEAFAKESTRLGLTIGPFVVYADFKVESFVTRDTAVGTCSPDASRPPSRRESGRDAGGRSPSPAATTRAWTGTTRRPTSSRTSSGCAGALRAGRPRHRPRAAQSQGPSRALPDQDGPGLPDLPGRRQPLGQDPRRHVPPADHRGQHHPQHRRLLGRARRLPRRRLAGPEGAGHGRDQLPEHLQAHPRQGLHGRPLHGARQEQARATRAKRPSSRPIVPATIFKEEGANLLIAWFTAKGS